MMTLERTTGRYLEESLERRLDIYFRHIGRLDCLKKTIGTADDLKKGTDCVIYGVPIDFTSDALKDNTVWHPEREMRLMNGVDVEFGIRTGNSHNGYTEFDEPTLVVYIKCFFGNIKHMMETIVDEFIKKFDDIFDVGQELYYDFVYGVES